MIHEAFFHFCGVEIPPNSAEGDGAQESREETP
jgi:hypothetical protein